MRLAKDMGGRDVIRTDCCEEGCGLSLNAFEFEMTSFKQLAVSRVS